MVWIANMLKSSLGLKLIMAVSGFCFCAFIVVHTMGNLTLFSGRVMFNSYAEHLHSLGVLLTVMEWILLILALVHIATGLTLFYKNLRARPVRYKVNHRAGGRTIGSATMPYTGVLVLAFLIIHLLDFHFIDKTGTTIFDIVSASFSSPLNISIYIIGVLVAAVHFSHGFWSAFQTIGLNHPKYMPTIRTLSVAISVIIGSGLGLLPIYIFFSA